jgi:hypothetical protein
MTSRIFSQLPKIWDDLDQQDFNAIKLAKWLNFYYNGADEYTKKGRYTKEGILSHCFCACPINTDA